MPNSRVVGHEYFKLKDSESESMWDDFEFGFSKSKYASYYEDFFNYVAADWTVTSTGSGSRALKDAVGGALLVTTGGTDDNSEELQKVGESFLAASGKKIYFEARFQGSDTGDSDILIGLSATDTTLIDGVVDGLYFSSLDGTDDLTFSATTSSVTSSESGINTLSDSNYVKVGFKVTGTGLVEYWVNDVKQGSILTNIPATELKVSFAVQAGSGNARELQLDYIHVEQER